MVHKPGTMIIPSLRKEIDAPPKLRLTEEMIDKLNIVCPNNIRYQLDEKAGTQKVAMWIDEKHDDKWTIKRVMDPAEVIERMKLELMHSRNSVSIMFGCLKKAGIIISEESHEKVITTDSPGYSMRMWSSWECWIMQKLNFKLWFCECHYQAPFGKVVMGGCEKHD